MKKNKLPRYMLIVFLVLTNALTFMLFGCNHTSNTSLAQDFQREAHIRLKILGELKMPFKRGAPVIGVNSQHIVKIPQALLYEHQQIGELALITLDIPEHLEVKSLERLQFFPKGTKFKKLKRNKRSSYEMVY